ncbi:hypothetical protein PspLS_06906, partial [Pyricularia sp. CBS 133598]
MDPITGNPEAPTPTEEGLLVTVQEAIDTDPLSGQEEDMLVSHGNVSLMDEKLYREASVRCLKRELNATSHFYMRAKSIAGTKAQEMAAAAAATETIRPQLHGSDPAQHSQAFMEDISPRCTTPFAPDIGTSYNRVEALTDELRAMVERLKLAHKVAFLIKTLRLQGAEYDEWVRARPDAQTVGK